MALRRTSGDITRGEHTTSARPSPDLAAAGGRAETQHGFYLSVTLRSVFCARKLETLKNSEALLINGRAAQR